ncbi:peptidylprolyl isomerase [Aquitalea magnusonii]|uniref:Chaperone SurA n=1 Tax=Aquitalea magnusonii TaxID=332411 RepID=A0A318JNR5_9NEIS|nr:peptidylprolyl isomerase [Aquitalea magnusonii]PXX49854.1 periplasmic chaperone for outer membrane proteins SurA [Aquitalea magnusonii]
MKKTLLALLIATFVQTTHAAPASPVNEMDRIVAVVNKTVITNIDLQNRIDATIQQLKGQNVTPPARDILARQVLEQMITEQVQMEYASSNGMRVDEHDLDQAIADLAKQNKLDVKGLQAQLAKEGVPFERFREEIRREIVLARLKNNEIGSRINVTDSEVDQVLKSAQSANRSEYHLATILISTPERADAKQLDNLSAKANKALGELNDKQPFAKVAASYSDAPNGIKGGDLGWRPAATLPPEFVSMLDQLNPGQHTGVIRTAQGFMIFQLIEKRSGNQPLVVEQYHTSHILIRTNEAVSEADAKSRILQIRDRILRGAKFSEMAKLYSEDGSNVKGGDLGWVNKGDMVPEFEKAMLALPVGTVSEPVRSPFGWHLILVEATRNQDVSADRERQTIKQQLRLRKLDQAYLDWVRQLRDSAFVEERLDDK